MPPAAVATYRERTPVSATSPTFCANAVYGNVLKTPPSTVPRPSARSPSASVRRDTGRSTTSPTATMSPVVSVMMTSPTTSIDTIEARSNVGRPKWNGVTTANQAASPMPDPSTMPGTNSAATVPRTSPSSTETRASPRGAKRSTSTTASSTPAAKATSSGSAAPSFPPSVIHPAATLVSETPMIRITVPVTIGGNSRTSCENHGATSTMKSPQAIVAP